MWQLRFMVMINQLGKFIPNFSWGHTAAKRALSKSSKWAWNNPQMKAFNKLKAELVKPMVLVPYNLETPTTVTANASSYGLGAVHCQKVDSVWKPVVFASRSLMETEWRYVEKEALGVTRACEKLSNYLRKEVQNWSRPVTSDSARWLKKKLDNLPPWILWFRWRLARFCYEVVHFPGKLLYTPDALSRAALQSTNNNLLLLEEAECIMLVSNESLPMSKETAALQTVTNQKIPRFHLPSITANQAGQR